MRTTSREMPSGFLWGSFGGFDFFSWGIGIAFLGNPNMSLASINNQSKLGFSSRLEKFVSKLGFSKRVDWDSEQSFTPSRFIFVGWQSMDEIRVFDYFGRERLIETEVQRSRKGSREEEEVGLEWPGWIRMDMGLWAIKIRLVLWLWIFSGLTFFFLAALLFASLPTKNKKN